MESTTAKVLKDLGSGFAGIREKDADIKKRVQRILEIKMASFRNCTLSISTALSLRKAVLIYVSEEAEDVKLMVVVEQTAGQDRSHPLMPGSASIRGHSRNVRVSI